MKNVGKKGMAFDELQKKLVEAIKAAPENKKNFLAERYKEPNMKYPHNTGAFTSTGQINSL